MTPARLAGSDVAGDAALARILDEMRKLHALASGPGRRAIDQRAADDDWAAAVRRRASHSSIDGVACGAFGDRLIGRVLVADHAAAGARGAISGHADAAGVDEGLGRARDRFKDRGDAGCMIGIGRIDDGVGVAHGALQLRGIVERARTKGETQPGSGARPWRYRARAPRQHARPAPDAAPRRRRGNPSHRQQELA